MRFEVPQFIEIEDRIFGPFTWRQFLYLGGGVGMGVVLFLTTPFIVFILVGLPLGGLALALAFFPINNRPFSYFLEAVFDYLRSERLYLWRRGGEVLYKDFTPTSTDPLLTVQPTTATRTNKTSISALARKLEMQALQKKQ